MISFFPEVICSVYGSSSAVVSFFPYLPRALSTLWYCRAQFDTSAAQHLSFPFVVAFLVGPAEFPRTMPSVPERYINARAPMAELLADLVGSTLRKWSLEELLIIYWPTTHRSRSKFLTKFWSCHRTVMEIATFRVQLFHIFIRDKPLH